VESYSQMWIFRYYAMLIVDSLANLGPLDDQLVHSHTFVIEFTWRRAKRSDNSCI